MPSKPPSASPSSSADNSDDDHDHNSSNDHHKPPPPPSTTPASFRTYYALCAIRLLLVLVPQTGYIHPDEFFQSLEPMAGDEFGLEHTRTWEFNTTAPLRSITVPYILVRLPLNMLRLAAGSVRYHFAGIDPLCSYMLLVWPRLIIAALSFANDWSMWRICRCYDLRPELRLTALASSWVMLVFGSRTFSNTVEMTLSSALLAIVADCMWHSNVVQVQADYLAERYAAASNVAERVRMVRMQSLLPSHSLRMVAPVAVLCAVGCFNRPTFVVFAAPAVFFWLLRGMGTRTTTFVQFNVRFVVLQLCAAPVVGLLVLADSLYYGHLSMAEVHRGEVSLENFVVTPLNFVRYNLDAEKTASHGVHAWWLHAVVNVPLLWNVLGVAAAVALGRLAWRFGKAEFLQLPRAQSIISLMIASIVVPLLALSCINHQEPRFLIPLTLPIIFTFGPELGHRLTAFYPFIDRRRGSHRGHSLLSYWFAINMLTAAFFGFIHQGGVLQLTSHLASTFRDQHLHPSSAIQTHLVTSNVYSLPTSLLFLPSTQTLLTNRRTGQKYTRARTVHLYEYGSRLDMDQLYARLKLIVDMNVKRTQLEPQRRYRVWLALPTSLGEELSLAFWRRNSTALRYQRERVFYPHVSTEAMPSWWSQRHPAETAATVFGEGALGAEQKCTLNRESNVRWADMWQAKSPNDWAAWTARRFSSVVHQFGLALYRVEAAGGMETGVCEG